MRAAAWLAGVLSIATFLPMLAIATIAGGAMAPLACAVMAMPTPPGSVVVMTWNVWGDAGDAAGEPFRDRAPYMVERIQLASPDVFAAQEAGWSERGPWFRKFVEDETGLTAAGDDALGKKALKIWFNAERLDELDAGVWLAPTGGGSKGAAWAKLRQKETGQEFYVLSVHLEHVHSENETRRRQMSWLLDQLATKNTIHLPVVIAGDLNSNASRASGNAPVELLGDEGFVNTLEVSASKPSNHNIGSAIGDYGARTLKVTHPKRAQIDYVFVPSGTPVHAWSLVPQSPIKDDKYTRLTSDHNAIVASVTPDGMGLGSSGPATEADPCSPERLNLVWADGTDCGFEGESNPNSCQRALAEAARIARESPCHNEVRGGTWRRRCLEFVGRVYGYWAAGTPTALQHYNLLKARGLVHTSQTDIPAGALVFFTTGQPEGHVAVYAGDGMAYSNDYLRRGCIDLTPMATMGSGGRYLGWAPPVFPYGAPL